MTQYVTPTDPLRELSAAKHRVALLERRLAAGGANSIPPAVLYHPGAVIVTTSGIHTHPYGATMTLVYAHLVVASTSGSVTLSLRKNGVEFGQLILPATVPYNEKPVQVAFGARFDRFQVAVTTAGTDAEQLSVFGVWDR